MIAFSVDTSACLSCGACVKDCVGHALTMHDGHPAMLHEENCIGCRHCLAVCPVGAVSVLGHTAADCLPLDGAFPGPDSLTALVRGRRSCRQYRQEDVDRVTLDQIFAAAQYAPTGVNARKLWICTLDTLTSQQAFREEVYARLAELDAAGAIPDDRRAQVFRAAPRLWREKQVDVLFRMAPHCLIVANAKDAPCATQDPIIYLSYFELLAHSWGLGTTWCGLLYWCITLFLPDAMQRLGMPDGYELSYCMLYGKPAVHYPRSVALPAAEVHRVQWATRQEVVRF